MNTVTLIGISVILFYSISQILTFYGVDQSAYGEYLLFYVFIILCILILPNSEPTT